MKTKSRETAGPPLDAACPTVAKIPEPRMAAIPKAVRSRTRSIRLSEPPCSASILRLSASVKMRSTDFFRNSSFSTGTVKGHQQPAGVGTKTGTPFGTKDALPSKLTGAHGGNRDFSGEAPKLALSPWHRKSGRLRPG